MSRFQLVFRDDDAYRIETRDNNLSDEPQIDGKLIVDGQTCIIHGDEWLLTREDVYDTKRFICTLVAKPLELSP